MALTCALSEAARTGEPALFEGPAVLAEDVVTAEDAGDPDELTETGGTEAYPTTWTAASSLVEGTSATRAPSEKCGACVFVAIDLSTALTDSLRDAACGGSRFGEAVGEGSACAAPLAVGFFSTSEFGYLATVTTDSLLSSDVFSLGPEGAGGSILVIDLGSTTAAAVCPMSAVEGLFRTM